MMAKSFISITLTANRIYSIGKTIKFSQLPRQRLRPMIANNKMSTSNTCDTGDHTDDNTNLNTGPGLLKILEKSPKRLKRIKFLGELFRSHGFELRIAGGAVRDIISGKEPQDIDFATNAKPEESLNIVSKHEDLLRIIVTAAGQKHGTVAVKFKEGEIDIKRIKLSSSDGSSLSPECSNTGGSISQPKEPVYDDESPFEITTLRCDKITDGRHAEVEFINDWRKDAERRDLTINAMFLTLTEGRLIDYFGGESDLKEGVVRFVGDAEKRIQEDYLRILRYFRFWSRYSGGKQPDQDTMDKIRSNLDGLKGISWERIWQELKKILSHLPCLEVVELMLKLRLFDYAGFKDESLDSYDQYTRAVLRDVKIVQENVLRYSNDSLKPQLDSNPDDESLKRLKELFPVILFSTIVQSEDLCLHLTQKSSAHRQVKFSNLEKDTILYIFQNRTKEPSINDLKYQLAMAPTPERHLLLRKVKAFLIYRGEFDCLNKLDNWNIPNFPLSGALISKEVKERRLSKNKTKEILESLKLDWAAEHYELSEDQLIQRMYTKLDGITIANKGNR